MKSDPRVSAYLEKARRAVTSAATLLNDGDFDGACNRAYYAMFDAAHAVLIAAGAEHSGTPIKTHNGLIAKFGLVVVQTEKLDASHAEALNAVQRIRLIADYSGEVLTLDQAQWALDKARAFIAAAERLAPR